ncbi:MAG TPA: PAS domain-containing protein [Longimicrobiales bacterium]|nr:PAS domain-containing protein [Longimicrobiales bacterium]
MGTGMYDTPDSRLYSRSSPASDPLFDGPGEMRALCRALDWSATPLGPVGSWPVSLRTIVGSVLGSRNPMFLFWGPDLVQIYNDAYRPSLGTGDGAVSRHPRALGMRGREFWTDIWDAIGPQIDQVMTTGVATWHEDQYLPIERDGRLDDVWWTYSYGPVHDDDGRINGVLVVCQETTQRILAEQALRRSEARLRAIFDSTYEYIGLVTPDGSVLDCNRASLQFVGNRREDVVGRKVWETPWFTETPGASEALRQGVARAAAGEFVRYETTLERPPRDPITFDFSLHPVRSTEGTVELIVPEGRDITDRKRDEEERERLLGALELERSRLAEVFRQAPSFLAVVRGPDHVFELANDAYYAMVGHRRIIGLPIAEALPEVREQGFIDLLDQVLATGEPYIGREVPIHLMRRSGSEAEERFVDFAYQPIREEDGTFSGIVAHGHDVTEQVISRRQVERLLAESEMARAEAESANRIKSQFLTTMSHELRTPLNAIGGYTELLQMGIDTALSERQLQFLDRIQQSQHHLLGLINEVLNFAKLETGTVRYDIVDVPVHDVLRAAEALVEPQARAKNLDLQIGDCPAALVARADAEKMRQIVINLLSNAVKFTEPGGRIAVSATGDEREIRVAVSDTGIGIDEDQLEAIFGAFVQVRGDLTRPYEGTGLGLAISRDLARGMGGDLTVRSTPGAGSTFTLILPAAL